MFLLWYTRADEHCEKLFFFFQAEDGIRDGTVTGVQTCALPIFNRVKDVRRVFGSSSRHIDCKRRVVDGADRHRSEERRVGKECRSRWSAYHKKTKRQRVNGVRI